MGLTGNILMLIQLSEDAALVHYGILQFKYLIITRSESSDKYVSYMSKNLK